jgi:competence protein ComEC
VTAAERAPVDLRLAPLACAAWTGAWLATSGAATSGWVVLGLVAVGLAATWLRRSIWIAATVVILVVSAALGWLAASQLASSPVARLAGDRAVAELVLEITSDPQLRERRSRSAYLTVRARAQELTGRGERWRTRTPVLVVVTGAEAIRAWRGYPVGEQVTVSARLAPPDPGSDIAALARARDPGTRVASPSALLQGVERVRSGLRDAVVERGAESRALVPALVLGDTSAMTEELGADFETTGLTHLTAVSGANLTLLLAFVIGAARWLGVRGWWLRGIGLVGVAVFVALCRTEPSVLRAAAMGLVALAALGSGGTQRGVRALSAAMLALLLVDPYLARSWGFGLSVLASAGIIWWAGRWVDLMTWLPRPLAEAVAVPLAAQLATLPVVASISGAVSLAGILTNALAGPFVGPATVLGFAAAGLSLVSAPLAAVAGFGAAWCAQVIIWLAHAGSWLPGASWRWPAIPVALAVLGAAALLLAQLLPVILSRWWLTASLTGVMVAGLLTAPSQPGWPPRDWMFLACDVGQGDGLLVRVGATEAMLVDAGPDPIAIDRCLHQAGVSSLPVVVLTHFHADHVDGLPGAVGGRRVGEIWISPLASPPYEAAALRGLATTLAAPVRSPPLGERGSLGSVRWEVLGPVSARVPAKPEGADVAVESSVENDASLVFRIELEQIRLLLTGDAEPDAQGRILRTGADLRADVLKLPHHGSARQDRAFLAATGATVAVASAGTDNDYGHPAPRTVELVRSLGMVVLRTDLQGSVAISRRDGQLTAVVQRE